MIYVLVLVLSGGNATRSVAMQEFNTKEQCEYVAKTMYGIRDLQVRFANCFEKGPIWNKTK